MEQDKIFIDIDNLPKKLSSSETHEKWGYPGKRKTSYT